MGITQTAQKLTRRGFLKGTAALTAVATLGASLFKGPLSTLEEGYAEETVVEDKWVPSVCRGCRVHCPIRVHVVNGVAVKIEGNPDDPNAQGKNCGRSQSAINTLYNPYRVKAPMKRTNPEKGLGVDPQWVEISWDEAIDTVVEKLKPILEENPSDFDYYMSNFADAHAKNIITSFFQTAYSSGMGATGVALTNGLGYQDGVCGDGAHRATLRHLGAFVESCDYEYTKYLLVLGTNFFGSGKGYPTAQRGFLNARDKNGMKVVVVDPVQADVARMADEWIPIKPGTDQAFALALQHALVLEHGLYDREYQKTSTTGPYLVGPDDFWMRSETEKVVDPKKLNQEWGKPLVWDSVDNVAKTWDDPTIKDFALEGAYTVNGVECKPGWQRYLEFIEQYTPEWAEEITDVPADTIRRIAKEMGEAACIGSTMTFYDDPDGPYEVPYRPVAIDFQKGAQAHKHCALIARSIGMLYNLLGATNVVGSSKGSEGIKSDPVPGVDGVVEESKEFSTYSFTYPPSKSKHIYFFGPETRDMDILVHPELYPEEHELYGDKLPKKALFHMYRNPLRSRGTGKMVEAVLRDHVGFIFTCPLLFDEMTEMSDIILPEPSFLERWEILVPGTRTISGSWWEFNKDYIKGFEALQQPVVEPIYNTRDMLNTMCEIADRLGKLPEWNAAVNLKLSIADEYALDLDKKYDVTEYIDRHFKTNFGEEQGLEWFMENGFDGKPVKSRKEWYPYLKHPETRFPIYDEWWVWVREQYKSDRAKYGLSPHEEAYADLIPLPEWHGVGNLEDADPEYNLFGCHYSHSFAAMCMPMEDQWKGEYMEKFARSLKSVKIHTSVAEKLGIKTGDKIYVESQYGNTVEGEAFVSEALRPDCIAIGGGGPSDSVNVGEWAHKGTHFNRLVSHYSAEHDQVSGNVDFTCMVKIVKA